MTDNRELLNDEEVDFLLQGAAEEDGAAAPTLDDGQQTVTMHGDLEKIRLADIFQTLAMSKMEGVLRLRNPLEERQVYCADGFVRILVPPRLTLRRLGQRLIQAGMLGPDELRSALLEQRKAHIPLGELLVRDNFISQEALDEILGMQVAEDLFALFTWQHGSFEFYRSDSDTEALQAPFEACPEYEINSLLLEVARRSDEWQLILDQVGSLEEVPVVTGEVADEEALEEAHEALLAVVDGQTTYRQLADRTTCGLFEFARAARDLSIQGVLGGLTDLELVSLAEQLAGEGERQRAVVLLQTLRDRQGDRDNEVIQGMAKVLELVGERRFAGEMLLEAAQRTTCAEAALSLGRSARALTPHDARALHFLRSVLLAGTDVDPSELDQVTTDLLDALIDDDHVARALEILAEHRAERPESPALLLREARAHQRAKDVPNAVRSLVELAELQLGAGDRAKAEEAYEAALRLDPSRKDLARTLAALRRTRVGAAVRWGAAALTATMVGAMGFVWLDQRQTDAATRQAMDEVAALLDREDRAAARQALQRWRADLGECEAIHDLTSRVAFAEAAEQKQRERRLRAAMTLRMSDAAEALGRGEVQVALDLYGTVHSQRGMAQEVEEIVTKRLLAALEQLRTALKERAQTPAPRLIGLLSRSALQRELAKLRALVPGALLDVHAELRRLHEGAALPTYLAEADKAQLVELIEATAAAAEAVRRSARDYEAALEQSDAERRLDPLFQEAVAREARCDFAGALELYRQLERAGAGDADLRAHIRDRVTRNATITKLMAALAAATARADHAAALQQLRALRRAFPEVDFDPLVELPLTVRSNPTIAEVYVDGAAAGVAPRPVTRSPASPTVVRVELEGFDPAERTFRGDSDAEWAATLTLRPAAERQHSSAIEAAPLRLPDDDLLVVDRAGVISRISPDLRTTRWRYDSGDLSGLLSGPTAVGDLLLVTSIDGPLRALVRDSGEVSWTISSLPSELPPVPFGDRLAVATTDGRLHLVDVEARTSEEVALDGVRTAAMTSFRDQLVLITHTGSVLALGADLATRWTRPLPGLATPCVERFESVLVVADDQGHLRGVNLHDGAMLWSFDSERTPTGLPTFTQGGCLVTTDQEILVVDAFRGQQRQAISTTGAPWAGAATYAHRRVVCATRDGALQVMDASSGQQLYSLRGGRESRVLPIGDRLLVVDRDHQVRSYDQLR